jgi:hypothetical protein
MIIQFRIASRNDQAIAKRQRINHFIGGSADRTGLPLGRHNRDPHDRSFRRGGTSPRILEGCDFAAEADRYKRGLARQSVRISASVFEKAAPGHK